MKHITQALAVVLLLACAIAHGATQNLNAEQGAALNVTLSGASSSLTGRSLRMHVRSKVGNTSTKLVASTADGLLSVASSSTATLSVGADVMAALSISDPTEYWVYDVASFPQIAPAPIDASPSSGSHAIIPGCCSSIVMLVS